MSQFLCLASERPLTRFLSWFALLIILLLSFYEAIPFFQSKILGGFWGDGGIYFWLVQRNSEEFLSSSWFETRAFYPYGLTLAWSDNFLLPSFFFWALRTAGVASIPAWNTLVLGALLANGVATYTLLYALTAHRFVSLCAGAGALLLLPLLAHLGHPQLLFFFSVPLTFFFMLKFLERPSLTRAFVLGFLVSCAFLTTVYYSLFQCLLILLVGVSVTALTPQRVDGKTIRTFLLGSTLGALPLIPFVLPYLEVKEIFGERGLYEPYYFAATTNSFMSATPWSRWYGVLSGLSHSEAHLFAGILIPVGAVIAFSRISDVPQIKYPALCFLSLIFAWGVSGIFMHESALTRWVTGIAGWGMLGSGLSLLFFLGRAERSRGSEILTNRGILGVFFFVTIAFAFLSQGPLGNPEKGEWTPGLYTTLYYLVPGFDALRAISRAGIVATFGMLCLYYLSIWRLHVLKEIPSIVTGALLVLPVIEQGLSRYPLDPIPPLPPVIAQSADTPVRSINGEVAIALPFAGELSSAGAIKSWVDFAGKSVSYMNWFHESGHLIVNGYSGQQTKFMREFPRRLSNFPDDRSLRALASIGGLQAIYVFPSLLEQYNDAQFRARLALFSSELSLERSDKEGNMKLLFNPRTLVSPDFLVAVPGMRDRLTFLFERKETCKEATSVVIEAQSPAEEILGSIDFLGTTVETTVQSNKLSHVRWLRFKTSGCAVYYRGVRFNKR